MSGVHTCIRTLTITSFFNVCILKTIAILTLQFTTITTLSKTLLKVSAVLDVVVAK